MSMLETKLLQPNIVKGEYAALGEATCYMMSWAYWLLLLKKEKLNPAICSQLCTPHHQVLSPASGSSWSWALSARQNSGKLTHPASG